MILTKLHLVMAIVIFLAFISFGLLLATFTMVTIMISPTRTIYTNGTLVDPGQATMRSMRN
jgi:hypothetical protein